jgi:hypothetical protein
MVVWGGAALGGAMALGGLLVIAASSTLDAAERFRQILGFRIPETGPDWYMLAVFILMASVPALLAIRLLFWYRGIWQRRLKQVWGTSSKRRQYSRIRRLLPIATPKELGARFAYLESLLASAGWENANLKDVETLSTTDEPAIHYRYLAEEMLKEIEQDITERAIATGLMVSLGSSRMDRLTILAAALEMQLHVLSRLGKRPSLGTWREISGRTSASLFLNTYLNREDTFAISFAIRRLAMGLDLVGDALEETGEMLSGDEEVAGQVAEGLAGGASGASMLASGIPLPIGGLLKGAMGLSATSLGAIADLTREAGDELLQGAVAGGVLYYHGMTIASDVLALDLEHRRSAQMTRTPLQGAMRAAGVGGKLLRDQVRRYRGAYSERATALPRAIIRRIPKRKNKDEQLAPPKALPDASQSESQDEPTGGSRPRRWNPLRRPPKGE